MIIATAGHVDHGKTTLLAALTGVHTAHLPEERRRGMTIDLGYAYLPLADGRTLGFIDVPGHEKFLPNMLAGIGGVQHALLLVACDDGVMPQTREHLTILHLLQIPGLTVVLSKADKVDATRIAEVHQQISTELAAFGWQNAPLFITAGQQTPPADLAALRQHLSLLADTHKDLTRLFRLSIDRAFTVKGAGLVVTGTALSGTVQEGDTLWLTSTQEPVRVRGIHSQNQSVRQAWGGERVALNISGQVSRQQIQRGDGLLQLRPPQPLERVVVALRQLDAVRHWQPVHLYHAASQLTGRISLLQEPHSTLSATGQLAELLLDRPLWLAEGDRLIIRDIAARQTLAGARVLLLDPPRRGKRQPAYLDWLQQLAQTTGAQQQLTLQLAQQPIALQRIRWARQLTAAGQEQLLSGLDVVIIADHALARQQLHGYQQRIIQLLEQEHQYQPDQQGVSRSRLRRMALPTLPEQLGLALIAQMTAQGSICNTRGWLHLPQHTLSFTDEQQKLWPQLAERFGDDAYWVRDLAAQQQIEESEMRTLLCRAAQLGYVVAIVRDRYYLTGRILQFAALIRALQQSQGGASAADFRDHLGIGRKLAIQILEFFDRTGFTRRQGDRRVLRDGEMFTSPHP